MLKDVECFALVGQGLLVRFELQHHSLRLDLTRASLGFNGKFSNAQEGVARCLDQDDGAFQEGSEVVPGSWHGLLGPFSDVRGQFTKVPEEARPGLRSQNLVLKCGILVQRGAPRGDVCRANASLGSEKPCEPLQVITHTFIGFRVLE